MSRTPTDVDGVATELEVSNDVTDGTVDNGARTMESGGVTDKDEAADCNGLGNVEVTTSIACVV